LMSSLTSLSVVAMIVAPYSFIVGCDAL